MVDMTGKGWIEMLSYEKCISLVDQWDPEGEDDELLEELRALKDVFDNSRTEDIEQALQESRDS